MGTQTKCTLLAVDDSEDNIDILVNALGEIYDISVAMDGEKGVELAKTVAPDLILLDIMMPKMDGFKVCRMLKSDPKTKSIPIIFVTAMDVVTDKTKGFSLGAADYITKPFAIPEVKARIKAHLALRFANQRLENQNYILDQKVQENAKDILDLNKQLKRSILNSIRVLMNVLETYDQFLVGHAKRVTFLSVEIGKELGLSKQELFDLEIAGLLHDIGMMNLPESLRTKLFHDMTEQERTVVKQHTIFAQRIFKPSADLKNVGVIVRHHHERVDGTGFPDELKHDEIPLCSRIIGIANAFDELKNRRRFTKEKFPSVKLAEDFAIHKLEKSVNRSFDFHLFEILKRIISTINSKSVSEDIVNIVDLKPSMKLVEDIFTTDGQLLVGSYTILGEDHVQKLKNYRKVNLIEKTIRIDKFIR